MFEARDRKGELRAIAGGGRYDQLLETLGGEHQPCAGFGFGDAVIMELLKDKKLLPQLDHQVLCNTLKHLPNVETRFYCPQTFLSLDFQCRDDVSELK